MKQLDNAEAVIEELGGLDIVAALTARNYKAVWNWKFFKKFPSNTFFVLQKALEAKGCTAPASLWSMVPAEEDRGEP